ncbi:MAG: pilus assembly protein PilM [Chitinispirillales bacterium]|nr:pilus assembly protein PilM [Chitinispirillales bacterium]
MFGNKGRSNYSVGLDVGNKYIKLVELRKDDDDLRLIAVGVKDLPEGVVSGGFVKDKDTFINAVKQLVRKCDPEITDVIVSMGTNGVLSDKIGFSYETLDNITEDILWEAKQRSPFDVDDITINYNILNDDEATKKLLILLVAAKNPGVCSYVDALYEAGLRPKIIDVSSYAFNNCYVKECELEEVPETLVLLDIGHQGSRFLFIKDGLYHSARDIGIGCDYILKTLQKQLKIDFGQATSIMFGQHVDKISLDDIQKALQFVYEEFTSGFDMAFSYYKKDSGDNSVEKIVICGGGVYAAGFTAYLSRHLGIEVTISDPFSFLKYDAELFNDADPSEFSALFSIATGLALRGV